MQFIKTNSCIFPTEVLSFFMIQPIQKLVSYSLQKNFQATDFDVEVLLRFCRVWEDICRNKALLEADYICDYKKNFPRELCRRNQQP